MGLLFSTSHPQVVEREVKLVHVDKQFANIPWRKGANLKVCFELFEQSA